MTNKINEVTIDDLALMVKGGFDDVHNTLSEIKGDIVEIKSDINEMKGNVVEMKSDIGELKRGQEALQLRQDNVPYRFELADLSQRVGRLEKVVLKTA